jgi:hypothetical protein
MMVLDFLKKDIVKLEITLDRQTYQPGDQINGRVTLQVDNEIKTRGAKISIFCQEKYQVRHRTHSSKGGSSTSYQWKTQTREVFSQEILNEIELPAHFYQASDFSWQVDSEALPSVTGKIVKVSWWAKATLDRPKAVDANTEAGFVVTIPIPGDQYHQSQELASVGSNDSPDEVDLSLWLPRTDWELGETIRGKLVMTAHKDLKLSDIRIELVQCEDVPESSGNTNESKVVETLAKGTVLTAGQSLSLPFQLTIPEQGLASFSGSNSSVTWTLTGILARRLATDYHVFKELQVYTTHQLV